MKTRKQEHLAGMLASLSSRVILMDTSWTLFPPSLVLVFSWMSTEGPFQILPAFQFKLQTAYSSISAHFKLQSDFN